MNKKLSKENIRLLGLSRKEVAVLDALRAKKSTPLLISKYAKVSRPAIYEILDRLYKRGLVKSNIRNGKKYWSQAKEKDLEQELYNTKKQLFDIEDGTKEVRGLSDSTVIVHYGALAIRKLVLDIVKNHKKERLYAIQGEAIINAWNDVVGLERINESNKLIKKNEIITEIIFPFGFLEKQGPLLGKKWMEDFGERMAIAHEIDEEYFNHAGQIWMFKNSLYLIAMKEETIIEVRNSEIQKLILSMFRFIQDNSRKFDVNARLREIIKKEDINN